MKKLYKTIVLSIILALFFMMIGFPAKSVAVNPYANQNIMGGSIWYTNFFSVNVFSAFGDLQPQSTIFLTSTLNFIVAYALVFAYFHFVKRNKEVNVE